MRLSLPALLSLLCTSAVGLDGCFGGPTNDWPHGNHGDDGDNGEDAPPPGMPSGTKTGDGMGSNTSGPPRGFLDAGSAAPITVGNDPSESDSDAGDSDAGMGNSDAGGDVADASSFDSGVVHACFAGADGGCVPSSCTTQAAASVRSASALGACTDADDLALVCDGELTRVVSGCAQAEALMLGLGTTVTDCTRSEPSLETASDGCIDCYVDELLCAAQNCLAPCLAGASPSCSTCRSSHCGAAFQACAGVSGP